ncbi:TPA: DUF6150 family protein [Enterobacter cloacae]|uniref:DUF6150 family protein n=1 Tax=Enterobacter chuandaensis TaxID=2497875 RepID=UPI0039C40082
MAWICEVGSRSAADIAVCVVGSRSVADLLVCRVESRSVSQGIDGLWCEVTSRSVASSKVKFVTSCYPFSYMQHQETTNYL